MPASGSSVDSGDANVKLRVKLFIGSQSGVGEGFGRSLSKEARAYGVAAECVNLENYTSDEFLDETQPAIFLVSTYGEVRAFSIFPLCVCVCVCVCV